MKKVLSLIAVLLVAVTGMLGQSPAPGILNYQGVARNSVGNVLVNKSISLRLTIRDGSAAGPVVYQESRGVTTNPFGLFNVQLGSAGASAVTGTIAGVPWGVGLKYIQVEIDPNGGSTFINIGTAQLASVPYSLYATTANDLVLPFNKTQSDAGTLFRVNNSGSGNGLMGTAVSGNGVVGSSSAGYGVTGTTNAANASGVLGDGTGAGISSGVMGRSGEGSYPGIAFNSGVTGRANANVGVAGYALSGIGIFGSSGSGTGGRFVSTSGLSLHTSGGGVRLQNINEGVNRILATIPGDGTATWQDPSVIGIITGSGTLNYVPKWTPNGTNLGNSQIFDNGTNVGLGTNTPLDKLHIAGTVAQVRIQDTDNGSTLWLSAPGAANTGGVGMLTSHDLPLFTNNIDRVVIKAVTGDVGVGTSAPLGKFHITSGSSFLAANLQGSSNVGTWLSIGNTDPGGRWFNLVNTATANGEGPGKLIFFQGGAANLATGSIMTMVHSNMNVGINSNNPTAKLQVDQNSATDVGVLVNHSNAANNANGVNVIKANTTSAGFGNGAIYAQRGAAGGTYFTLSGASGITSLAALPGGIGIQGTTDAGSGVVGLSTNGIGVRGFNLNSGNAARFDNLFNTANTAPVVLVNNISTVPSAFGVHSIIANTTPGSSSTALRGQNNGTAGFGIGVWGSQNGSGWGVLGTAPGGLGVYGFTTTGIGVVGEADGGWGMRAISNTNTAIFSTSNSGFGGDFRSQTNIAGIFQSWGAGNTVRGAIQTFNPSTNAGARALYAQGSGFSGWTYVSGQVSEFQGNTTAGIVSISTNANSIVSASETGNAVYGQILTTNGNGNAAVLGASSNPNSHGLYGIAPNGGIGRALATAGPVQLTGINEATNRILASTDNFGNARWENPGDVGIVSGSGTLNYVPKWTPNGTTLGNSLIFDNGIAVGIGTTTPTSAVKLDLVGTFSQFRLFDTDQNSQVWLSAPGLGYTGGVGTLTNHDFPIFTNATDKVMVKNTGRVGIGTANPTAFTEILGNSIVGTPHLKLTENADDYGRLTLGNINPNNSGNNFWDIAGYTNDTRANERLNFYNAANGDLMSITGDGRVGIGTFNPLVRFHVNSGNAFGTSLLEAQDVNNAGPHQYFYSGGELGIVDYIRTDYTVPADAHRRGALEVRGWTRLNLSPTNSTDMTTGMTIRSNGNVGIGTASPIWKVDISSTLAAMRLRDSDDAADIYLLAAGAGYTGGVGTSTNHDLPIFTNNIDRLTVKAATGDVGIATFTPAGRLHLVSNPNSVGIISEANYTTVAGLGSRRYGNLFSSLNTNFGIVAKTGAVINSNLPVLRAAILGIDSSIGSFSNGIAGYGIGNSLPSTIGVISGVYGFGAVDAAPISTAGFPGFSGGTFWGGDNGINAGIWNTIANLEMNGTEPNKAAVQAFVETNAHPGINYGVYVLRVSGGATNYAGYFNGDVHVQGNLSASGAKPFKIDHPLDPANKYLTHFALESPEVQNVYNGNITTDAAGKAMIQLPDYFSAVNKDFKYQLTIVDESQFAMARVSKKMSGNSFEIMTSVPNIEVSWQVTAVRNDKAIQKYAVPAEMNKPTNEKGKYLNPELYGQPASKGVHYMAGPKIPTAADDKGQMVPVTVTAPQPKQLPVPSQEEVTGQSSQVTEEIRKTWAKPIEKPASDNTKAEPGSTGNKVIMTESMLPKEPVKPVPANEAGKITPANTNAAANTGAPLMKPVMTGQLQRGTAPAAPVADDPNNKERGKLNKVQGEKPAAEPAKPSEVPIKFEKGQPEAEK